MNHLYYATGNENKYNEAKVFIEGTYPKLHLDQLAVDIPEIQSNDPNEILEQKVAFVRQRTNAPFIVDDASFYTDRFPQFPGSYAKFTNETLGYEGWRRLFDDGDNIRAVARLALHNFGDITVFDGFVDGKLDLSSGPTNQSSFSLNEYFVLPDGRTLKEALEDSHFQNHRRSALGKLGGYLADTNNTSETSKSIIGARWSERAPGWQKMIEDKDSYVNYEDNYERANTLIQKYAPLVSGTALEVGCGTGEAGRILKSSNPDLRLLATDISEGMLEEARILSDSQGLDIEYRKLDITSDDFHENAFDIVISRGVVVSHLPKSNIFDFLESVASHTANGGYLLFDFIQNTSVGAIEKPVDSKNEFTVVQMDEIMSHFGMGRVDDAGNDRMRVRVVCYQKLDNRGQR